MYQKVLLAYDGSVEGRRALREGAKLAQICGAEVFLLAVVENAPALATLEGGVGISMDEQISAYKAVLAEGVERLKAVGFSPTARLGMGAPAQQIAAVNKLMQSVDEGLNRLLKHFSKSSSEPQTSRYKHRRLDIVFDSSAEFDASGERQRAADAVMEEARKKRTTPAPRTRRKKAH